MLQKDRCTVPLEERMGTDGDADEQIAGGTAVAARAALPPEGHGLAVVNAGGNTDGDLALLADTAGTAAVLTGLMDQFALAAALGTGGGGGKGESPATPLDADGTAAVAVGADLRCGAGGAAAALAGIAVLGAAEGDLLLAAEGGLLEGDGH